MKRHLVHHFPTIIFCLLIFVGSSSAQPLQGVVKGIVTVNGGALRSAPVITLIKKDSASSRLTIVNDINGRFIFHAEFGDYELQTKLECMTGKNGVQINSTEPIEIKIDLAFENCEEKAATEERIWSEFGKESPDSQEKLNDIDKKNIVNLIFQELLSSESEWVTSFYGNRELIVSAENIRSEWVKTIPNLHIVFLGGQEIKARTKKKGVYDYLLFYNWTRKSSGISVNLSRITAIGKRPKKVFTCDNGSTAAYIYLPDSRKLVKRVY